MIEPVHGIRKTYRNGCKCLPCRAANAKDKSTRHRHPKLVDAAPAKAHIHYLKERGLGYRRIAKLAGVGAVSVADICNGKYKRTSVRTASAILGVTKAIPAPRHRINSAKTLRQIAFLRSEGFSSQMIADRIGKSRLDRSRMRKNITVRFAVRIDSLYRSMRE